MARLGAIAENIALLALLNPKEPVPENPIPSKFIDDGRASHFILSFEDERRTAEAFAILLSNTDNPRKVGAVCVEQSLDGHSLTIRTAVNAGPQTDRKDAFARITSALRKASCSEPLKKQEDVLLNEIIGACQLRLLGRLRSRHAKSSRQSGRVQFIHKLRDNLKLLDWDQNPPKDIDFYWQQVDSLIDLFGDLESLPPRDARSESGRAILNDIIRRVGRVLRPIDTRSILNNPSHPRYDMIRSLNKLHQYRHAARYLLSAARKFHAFHDLRIEEVKPFGESKTGAESLSVRRGLFSRSLTSRRQKNFVRLVQEQSGKSLSQIEQELQKHPELDKRVHAEIQLLFHYECQMNTVTQPRVIVSNKQACLLCDLLIKTHGGFYTPSSHGTLYPRWRIPRSDEVSFPTPAKARMVQCLDQFNRALETKIKKFAAQKCVIPNAPESVIFRSYNHSTSSTVPTPTTAGKGSEGNPEVPINRGFPSARTSIRSRVSSISTKLPASTIEDDETKSSRPLRSPVQSDTTPCPCPPKPKRALSLSSSQTYAQSALKQPRILTRGVPTTYTMSPGSVAQFQAPRIHLDLSYEQACALEGSSLSPSCTSARSALIPSTAEAHEDLTLQVEWLDAENTKLGGLLERIVDIAFPWARKRRKIADGALFKGHGLVFVNKDNAVSLKAIGPG
ncbi:hypothetical protein D8B26_004535 [Coccidioides posadasii str. Silveira]|uniref:Uncharacterized protein n=1 Tax=Coccidioides posadasii (strain RMSCC 757 / Silveira) TaxID=443226 RepID=E9DEQ4_COCPS|nr:conserved hypothetical protein [Coccidioides posadasii str. Silveira]QVM09875.1 hypothetical protein D8B26_004535 [Coccidioides posadasii str. Silveira]